MLNTNSSNLGNNFQIKEGSSFEISESGKQTISQNLNNEKSELFSLFFKYLERCELDKAFELKEELIKVDLFKQHAVKIANKIYSISKNYDEFRCDLYNYFSDVVDFNQILMKILNQGKLELLESFSSRFDGGIDKNKFIEELFGGVILDLKMDSFRGYDYRSISNTYPHLDYITITKNLLENALKQFETNNNYFYSQHALICRFLFDYLHDENLDEISLKHKDTISLLLKFALYNIDTQYMHINNIAIIKKKLGKYVKFDEIIKTTSEDKIEYIIKNVFQDLLDRNDFKNLKIYIQTFPEFGYSKVIVEHLIWLLDSKKCRDFDEIQKLLLDDKTIDLTQFDNIQLNHYPIGMTLLDVIQLKTYYPELETFRFMDVLYDLRDWDYLTQIKPILDIKTKNAVLYFVNVVNNIHRFKGINQNEINYIVSLYLRFKDSATQILNNLVSPLCGVKGSLEVNMKMLDDYLDKFNLMNFEVFLLYKRIRGTAAEDLLIKRYQNGGGNSIIDLSDYAKYIITDSVVLENWNFLVENVGIKKVSKLTATINFWTNPHDHLLFVQAIKKINSENLKSFIDLILLPILLPQTNLLSLNEYIPYIDIEKYIQEFGNTPIKNYSEFERIAILHKNNIEIPSNATPAFANVCKVLIAAPGVDVNFIKLLINLYINQNLDFDKLGPNGEIPTRREIQESDDRFFAYHILEIIEGEIDPNITQKIKPFEHTMPFNPIHKLVGNALGIQSLNKFTPKISSLFKSDISLSLLLKKLITYNQSLKLSLIENWNKNNQNNPENTNKDIAEINKQWEEVNLLEIGAGSKLQGLNMKNYFQTCLDDEILGEFKKVISNLLLNEDNKNLILDLLRVLNSNSGIIKDYMELSIFEQLSDRVKSLFVKNEDNDLLTNDEIIAVLKGYENQFIGFLIYLGFNNLTRQTNFKNLKKEFREILGKQIYLEEIGKFKDINEIQTRIDEVDFYVNGGLDINEQDLELVKNILVKNGYGNLLMSMKMEIVPKSDPRGWVAGHYTDCCMKLTEPNNLEYMERADCSYFIISIIDSDGNEDLIAQSVLVDTLDESGQKVLAIDNIEIGNRALKYRGIIAQAYEHLKNKYKDRKIIIGTTYNDDGGTVTSNCPLIQNKFTPTDGKLDYTDCFLHDMVYLYHDPALTQSDNSIYYGLQIDNIGTSFVRSMLGKDEYVEILSLLSNIAKGVPDGDGGMSFADNYSCIIGNKENYKGYIVAADYIVDRYADNYLYLEKLNFNKNLTVDEIKELIIKYFDEKMISQDSDLNGICLRKNVLGPSIKFDFLIDYFKKTNRYESIKKTKNGDVLISFLLMSSTEL